MKQQTKLLQQALNHLDEIDFVGIVERMDEFILMLAHVFQLEIDERLLEKENSNSERFGLDLTNSGTRKAIEPLIAYDRIIYAKAREKYIDQFHAFLAIVEKNRHPRYTVSNKNCLRRLVLHE